MKRGFLRRAATGSLSGLRRYPRHILASVQPAGRPVQRIGHGPDLDHFGRNGLSALWIGHATVLLSIGGVNILTDPVFSHRIGLKIGSRTIGLARLAPPALDIHHLPRIDLILLSHAHFDHLDKPSLRHLASPETTVVTAAHTRRLVPPGFQRVIELGWSEHLSVAGVSLTALRPAHWGARTAYDKHRGYNSYLIQAVGPGSGCERILFAGDTAMTDAFDAVGPVDLAVFGVGGYNPWKHAHANPEQVWSMFSRVRGRLLLPVHHSTFHLSEEPTGEPMQRLLAVAGPDHRRIVCRDPGQVWSASGATTPTSAASAGRGS